MSADYYLYTDQQYGPYDLPALEGMLKQGQLTKDSFIFREGETADWIRAEEVSSLKILFQAAPTQKLNFQKMPTRVGGLAAKLQRTAEPAGEEGFGTMLVSPTSGAKVKNIESALPDAPLSDIPAQGGTAAAAAKTVVVDPTPAPAPAEKKGFFQKLFGIFGRKS